MDHYYMDLISCHDVIGTGEGNECNSVPQGLSAFYTLVNTARLA